MNLSLEVLVEKIEREKVNENKNKNEIEIEIEKVRAEQRPLQAR